MDKLNQLVPADSVVGGYILVMDTNDAAKQDETKVYVKIHGIDGLQNGSRMYQLVNEALKEKSEELIVNEKRYGILLHTLPEERV